MASERPRIASTMMISSSVNPAARCETGGKEAECALLFRPTASLSNPMRRAAWRSVFRPRRGHDDDSNRLSVDKVVEAQHRREQRGDDAGDGEAHRDRDGRHSQGD